MENNMQYGNYIVCLIQFTEITSCLFYFILLSWSRVCSMGNVITKHVLQEILQLEGLLQILIWLWQQAQLCVIHIDILMWKWKRNLLIWPDIFIWYFTFPCWLFCCCNNSGLSILDYITPHCYMFQTVKTSLRWKYQFVLYFQFQFSWDHASLLHQQK